MPIEEIQTAFNESKNRQVEALQMQQFVIVDSVTKIAEMTLNIGKEANSVDPGQTALQEQSDQRLDCSQFADNILTYFRTIRLTLMDMGVVTVAGQIDIIFWAFTVHVASVTKIRRVSFLPL